MLAFGLGLGMALAAAVPGAADFARRRGEMMVVERAMTRGCAGGMGGTWLLMDVEGW